MQIVIVTGMSGAGKSTALNVLEDQGYYCVDNMPVPLIPHFAKLAKNQEKHQEKDGSKGHETVYDKIALGVDIRNGDALGELSLTIILMNATKSCFLIPAMRCW